MPRVSVIMAVFQMAGKGSILKKAVASIQKQTLSDWELLIYDDGSTDHTLQEVQRIVRGDSRIRVLYGPVNRKAGYARNRCIRAAKGRYLAIMDADDISEPDRLKVQADFLDAHPEYAFTGSSAWMFDNRGVWGLRTVEERPGRESFLSTLPFVHPSVMLRREAVLVLHGYREGPDSYRVEDYEFLMRMYAAGYRGYNIQKPLLRYREDASAYRRRKYRYRITECRMRLQGFTQLGILRGNVRYVLKPLAAGLVPAFVMQAARAGRYRISRDGNRDKNTGKAVRKQRKGASRPERKLYVQADQQETVWKCRPERKLYGNAGRSARNRMETPAGQ